MPDLPGLAVVSDVIMGLCPGCLNWQIQFNTDDITPLEVEAIVAHHAHHECPGLMSLMISTVFGAGPNNPPDMLVGMDIYGIAEVDDDG